METSSHLMPSHEPQLDETAALAALDGQRELLVDLAGMFREDAPQLLQSLETALADANRSEARRAAHSLKGLASTFFAKRTVDRARELESLIGDESVPLEELGRASQLEGLKFAVRQLIAELEQAGYLSQGK